MSEPQTALHLPLMVLARAGATATFMVYAACLTALRDAWGMTAAQAGAVQGAFTAAMALSLLATSFLCDRFGAKRVFLTGAAACALAGLLMTAVARSYETGLVTMALLGLAQGAAYTPAVMLAATNAPPARKNAAVGWVLAGMSAGYVVSIGLANLMLAVADYRFAFLATSIASLLGAIFAWRATHKAKDTQIASQAGKPAKKMSSLPGTKARLLTAGYVGHSWELLGMWAWTPAFMAAALAGDSGMSGVELGVWIALALHLSGFFSSFLAGGAADRFGARPVLIAFAIVGCLCSAGIGWGVALPPALLIAWVAVYGFVAIGDSAVLSAAMTDAVPPERLGRALGVRSVLGIGAGAIAPIAFGLVLDSAPAAVSWGLAFAALGIGGAVATVCAVLLPKS